MPDGCCTFYGICWYKHHWGIWCRWYCSNIGFDWRTNFFSSPYWPFTRRQSNGTQSDSQHIPDFWRKDCPSTAWIWIHDTPWCGDLGLRTAQNPFGWEWCGFRNFHHCVRTDWRFWLQCYLGMRHRRKSTDSWPQSFSIKGQRSTRLRPLSYYTIWNRALAGHKKNYIAWRNCPDRKSGLRFHASWRNKYPVHVERIGLNGIRVWLLA